MTLNGNVYLPPSPVIPPFLVITAITNAVQAVITVAIANSYIAGQLVHLSIPASYGMYEANSLTAEILNVNGLNWTMALDTTQFNPFVVPPDYQEKPASIAPAGSRNLYNNQTVPFHSEGNIGN